MYLIINTIEDKKIEVILAKDEKNFKISQARGEHKQSEKLLVLIDKILKTNKINLKKIKGIGVVSGPGGFTSVRIGTVVANTLAFAIGVEVFGIKLSNFVNNEDLIAKTIKAFNEKKTKKIVLPFYNREPNIG